MTWYCCNCGEGGWSDLGDACPSCRHTQCGGCTTEHFARVPSTRVVVESLSDCSIKRRRTAVVDVELTWWDLLKSTFLQPSWMWDKMESVVREPTPNDCFETSREDAWSRDTDRSLPATLVDERTEKSDKPGGRVYKKIEWRRVEWGATQKWSLISSTCVGFSTAAALDSGGYLSACSLFYRYGRNIPLCHEHVEQAEHWDEMRPQANKTRFHPIVSSLAYVAAATTLYHVHKDDQYQDCFLFGGILLGMTGGMGITRDLQETMLTILPWTILLSLVCSIAYHRIRQAKGSARVYLHLDCGQPIPEAAQGTYDG